MHPENAIKMGEGQLFLAYPENEEPVALGTVEILEGIAAQDIDDAQALKDKAVAYLKQMDQAEITLELTTDALAYIYVGVVQIVEEQCRACIEWAKVNRKKWLHIGRTTKKARTRKKYARLIWRDYRAAALQPARED